MSIWRTIGWVEGEARDNYTGEPSDGNDYPKPEIYACVTWHDCIRFSVADVEVLIDPDETRAVIKLLTDALASIGKEAGAPTVSYTPSGAKVAQQAGGKP